MAGRLSAIVGCSGSSAEGRCNLYDDTTPAVSHLLCCKVLPIVGVVPVVGRHPIDPHLKDPPRSGVSAVPPGGSAPDLAGPARRRGSIRLSCPKSAWVGGGPRQYGSGPGSGQASLGAVPHRRREAGPLSRIIPRAVRGAGALPAAEDTRPAMPGTRSCRSPVMGEPSANLPVSSRHMHHACVSLARGWRPKKGEVCESLSYPWPWCSERRPSAWFRWARPQPRPGLLATISEPSTCRGPPAGPR